MIKERLTRVANRGFGLIAAVLMRRSVAWLARINESSLREVGLSRAAMADFLQTPLNTDAGQFFAARNEPEEPPVTVMTAAPGVALRSPGAPEHFLAGQLDARDGPSPRRDHRQPSSKSRTDLAKEMS
ncbi:MAG: hypothetical protein JWR89_1606 [Tardiphaga sp.]|uniref:hypothetical protein n=1 Tax=Tardiphaga sp. TaxID=1926292 RepID=UPI002633E290|nr:hypothetical protein [Tardiphaga sp.]MDB5501704.1 hypothetical protein [Tardiphaga sp.]